MSRRQKLILVTIFYSVLTLLFTYPVFWQLGVAVAGFDGRDPFQHVWYQWWMKETLLELRVWPDQVIHLYYPLGASHPVLALHPYVPLFSLPFTLLCGPLISYNVAFLLSFIFSGLTGYLLCRHLCGHTWAAILGGLIFAFYPNRFGHATAGHLLLITNYFLPLYALSLLVLLRRPSAKRAAWHGIVTAILALAQPTHIGYGIIPLFLVLVGGHIAAHHSPIRHLQIRPFTWLFIANLLAAIIFLPFAWPILSQSQGGELTYLTPKDLTEHSADLLAFIMPSPYNPLLAKMGLVPAFSASIIDGFRDLEEQLAYPGLVALGLSGLALWKRWRDSRIWLGLTLVCALLSLGPFLKIGGQVQDLPLSYIWLARLPFFAWSRAPGRLNETVMLGVAVLAALGADWLFQRKFKSIETLRYRYLVATGLSILILIEYVIIFPFPTEERPISDYYPALAYEAIDGGVLEMPVTGSRRASNYAMYYQTVHGHFLAGGYIERDPAGTVELKEFLNQLLAPIPDQTVFTLPNEAERRTILAEMKIERVIVHPTLMTDRAARSTRDYLPVLLEKTIFEDEEILVYPIRAGKDGDLPAWQVLPDQDNWEMIKEGAAFRLKKEGYLFIYAVEAGNVGLKFQVDSPPVSTQLSWQLNDSSTQSYLIESTADYTNGPLPLRQGFNYFWLSTAPPQDIEFLEIAIQPVVGAGNNG